MSVFEYARRLVPEPRPPTTGPEMLEELAQLLVDQAIALRTLAELWRESTKPKVDTRTYVSRREVLARIAALEK